MFLTPNEPITDELLTALSITSWLVEQLKQSPPLREDFRNAGDATEGEYMYWQSFQTLVVELLLESNKLLRETVYKGEVSVVSVRDIRRTCELLETVFTRFLCDVRAELEKSRSRFPYFGYLDTSLKVSLIDNYCLRLTSRHRAKYLQRIHRKWNAVRQRFPEHIDPNFLPNPNPLLEDGYNSSEIYSAFDDLCKFILKDFELDSGIAVNQALKENSFAILAAVCTKTALFIVGRPGSTKSRALELLVRATEDLSRENSFFSRLGVTIQKHVVQCSPDTTAHHIAANAKRAALSQLGAERLGIQARQCIIVLEEVGATIGSRHNPLMSLHSMIDHGVTIVTKEGKTKKVRLPIIGISNYQLDASKMGRGRVVYRGNPPIKDLNETAEAILRGMGGAMLDSRGFSKDLSSAFSRQILENNNLSWFFGMRDFYAVVSTLKRLAVPVRKMYNKGKKSWGRFGERVEINAHTACWAVMINLMGFPVEKKERDLGRAMVKALGGAVAKARWGWGGSGGKEGMRLCECCCRMLMYREVQQWMSENPGVEVTDYIIRDLFERNTTIIYGVFFLFFFFFFFLFFVLFFCFLFSFLFCSFLFFSFLFFSFLFFSFLFFSFLFFSFLFFSFLFFSFLFFSFLFFSFLFFSFLFFSFLFFSFLFFSFLFLCRLIFLHRTTTATTLNKTTIFLSYPRQLSRELFPPQKSFPTPSKSQLLATS